MKELIKNAIANSDYEYYGIRIDDSVSYQIGERTAKSRIWIDGECTDETLNGTSCVGIKFNASDDEIQMAINIASQYYGDKVSLIASNNMEYGEDIGEYILKDAIVIKILK